MTRGFTGGEEDWDLTDKVGDYQLTENNKMRKLLKTREERVVGWILVGVIIGSLILLF